MPIGVFLKMSSLVQHFQPDIFGAGAGILFLLMIDILKVILIFEDLIMLVLALAWFHMIP